MVRLPEVIREKIFLLMRSGFKLEIDIRLNKNWREIEKEALIT